MIVPALRSASIAICLPGIASRVKRAETSLILSAPFVITINWMITSIKNITSPTTKLPPATKPPNVWIISPASACRSINLVEATLRESRNSVTKRSSEGKVDNSRASFEDNVTIKTATARDILQARSMSNNMVGRGIISVARTVTMPTAIIILLWDARGVWEELSSTVLRKWVPSNPDEFCCAEPAIIILSIPLLAFASPLGARKQGGNSDLRLGRHGSFGSDSGTGAENLFNSNGELPVYDDYISSGKLSVLQIQVRRFINRFIELQYRAGSKL